MGHQSLVRNIDFNPALECIETAESVTVGSEPKEKAEVGVEYCHDDAHIDNGVGVHGATGRLEKVVDLDSELRQVLEDELEHPHEQVDLGFLVLDVVHIEGLHPELVEDEDAKQELALAIFFSDAAKHDHNVQHECVYLGNSDHN